MPMPLVAVGAVGSPLLHPPDGPASRSLTTEAGASARYASQRSPEPRLRVEQALGPPLVHPQFDQPPQGGLTQHPGHHGRSRPPA